MRIPVCLFAIAAGAIAAGVGAQRTDRAAPGATMFRGDAAHSGVSAARGVPYLGGLLWRFQTSGPVRSSPTLSGRLVLIGSGDGHLYAIDRHTGREQWRFAAGSSVASTPATANGATYFSTLGGSIFSVATATGRQRWRVRTGPDVPFPWGHEGTDYYASSPVVAGGPILSSPLVDDGVLFVGSDDGAVYALRAGERTLARAVFWDSLAIPLTLVGQHVRVRDYLRARGYELLDAAGLRAWMEARLVDGAPSVVVFALDHAPRLVAPVSTDTVLMRRYLNAAGKVVWLGLPPRMWVPDATGARTLSNFGGNGTAALLGVDVQVDPFDRYGARPTRAGTEWGLSGWWITGFATPAPANVEILATDERGLVAAWARRYGGPPGTGFVSIPRLTWDDDALRQLATVAEHRPLQTGN